jgi:hypothetical protein
VSFKTVAIMGAVAFTSIELGGTCVRLTLSPWVTVNVEKALNVWSAVAKAVIVTVPPTMVGVVATFGTLKVIGTPDWE